MALENVEIIPVWDVDEEEWRELRRPGLGGSDIGTICGLNKYQSELSLYHLKRGDIPGFAGNEATDLGHALERWVAEQYAREHNAAVVEWPVLLRRQDIPFMAANLDFLVVQENVVEEPSSPGDGIQIINRTTRGWKPNLLEFKPGTVTLWQHPMPPPGIIKILECKTGAIASPGKPGTWFINGESIPPTYQLQGMWYMGVTGIPEVQFACLLGGHGMQYRTLDFDQEQLDDVLTVAATFWQHILDGVPPDVDGSDSTEETLKELYPRSAPGQTYEGGQTLAEAWETFQALKQLAEEWDSKRKAARAKVVDMLREAEYGTVNGETICSYKTSRDSEVFDSARFVKEHPDIAAQYQKKKSGIRTLREVK